VKGVNGSGRLGALIETKEIAGGRVKIGKQDTVYMTFS
jgi:hypothetical protein